MDRVYDFFKKNPTFCLATVDGEQARVRPFGAVAKFEGKLYLCTNNEKDVYRQMKQSPRVELCGMDAGGAWLRVAATAVEDDRDAARERMLAENEALRGMYAVGDGRFAVFYLQDATATFSSFAGAPEVVAF